MRRSIRKSNAAGVVVGSRAVAGAAAQISDG
jgi:hypothetical protein